MSNTECEKSELLKRRILKDRITEKLNCKKLKDEGPNDKKAENSKYV